VLTKIRTSYPRWVVKAEIDADPITGGKVAATRKALQRLEKKGLITSQKKEGRYGVISYQAVLARARGEGSGGASTLPKPSDGGNPRVDNEGGQPQKSATGAESVHSEDVHPECPPSEVSADAGSASVDTSGTTPRAGAHEAEPSNDERQAAFDRWKI